VGVGGLSRAVFLDRDGVLNQAVIRDGKPYPPSGPGELVIVPDALASLQDLKQAGFLLIVITNQPDIARGTQDPAAVESIHQALRQALPLDDFFVCVHDDSDHCDCRKPQAGLLLRAAEKHGIDLSRSFMVGDRWRDVEAGASAGCATVWIDYGYREKRPSVQPSATVDSVRAAADWILQQAKASHGNTEAIRESYDRLADEYAKRIFHELQHKPLDRELLDRFAAKVAGKGEVCDMGCGPGHVARYLRDAGTTVFGLDLSPRMLDQARQLNPDISFREGNMLSLDLPDGTLAGIAAFYAIVNISKDSLPAVFREMQRVLQPDGVLLLAFHSGDEVLHADELWGRPISMDFFLFQTSAIRNLLEAAGFAIEEIVERDPYPPEVEHQSRRAYIFARKSF
jgi:histidinol-phosphate phosphatase family protein